MSLSPQTTLDTYDMAEDATGLAVFINYMVENHISQDEAPVVYVMLPDGSIVTSARFVEETLTDGSKAYNLYLGAED